MREPCQVHARLVPAGKVDGHRKVGCLDCLQTWVCHHETMVRAGHTKAGSQRLRCKCGEKWTTSPKPRLPHNAMDAEKADEVRAFIDKKLSLREVAALTGVTKTTVLRQKLLMSIDVDTEIDARPSTMKEISLDAVKDIVLTPKRDEDFYPLLLFKGGQSIGRVQALWNFTRAMRAAEANSVSAFCTFSQNSPDVRHLLGLHARIQHMSVRGFLSRLWFADGFDPLDDDMREYLAFVAGGNPERFYWRFTPVPRYTQWKTKHPWRKLPKHLRPVKPPKTESPQFWPFISGDVQSDHDTLMKIDAVVPKHLPEQVRQDVCQDLVIAVLSGAVSIGDLQGSVPKHVSNVFKLHPLKYGPLSLDAPAPWQKDDDRPLSRFLATE